MARRKKTDDDEPKDNLENINDSDDNFGLPEIEYQPLNREELRQEEVQEEEEAFEAEETPSENDVYITTTSEEGTVQEEINDDHIFNRVEETPSGSSRIIGVLFLLLLAGALAWFFMVYKPKKAALAEKARQEEIARAENAKRQEEELRLAELKRQEDEQRRADSLANAIPKVGTIETLTGRTGRYYVIVASDIDVDLMMDYAHKLSAKGVSSTILPRFRKGNFYRIAVANSDTYSDAQTSAENLAGEYPDGAWVIKY